MQINSWARANSTAEKRNQMKISKSSICAFALLLCPALARAQYRGVLPILFEAPASPSVVPSASNAITTVATWTTSKTGKYRIRATVVLSPGTVLTPGDLTLALNTSAGALPAAIAQRKSWPITLYPNSYDAPTVMLPLTLGDTVYLLAQIPYLARGSLAFTQESGIAVEEVP